MTYRYFRCLNRTKKNPLSLAAQLVYSYLANRDRIKAGATLTQLRRALRLSRTTAPAVDKLVEAGLVRAEKGRAGSVYRAVPPGEAHAGWFTPSRRAAAHWSGSFMAHQFWLPAPSCPLSVQQVAAYMLIRDLNRQGSLVCFSGMATLLACHPRTVKRAVERLAALGLVGVWPASRPGKHDVQAMGLTGEHADWFVRAEPRRPAGPVWLQKSREIGTEVDVDRATRLVEQLRASGDYAEGCEQVWDQRHLWTGLPKPNLDLQVSLDFLQAFYEWDTSRPRKAKTCLPLFRHLLAKRVERAEKGQPPLWNEFELPDTYQPG